MQNASINTDINNQTINALHNCNADISNERYITIMGITFDKNKDTIPDFGSIRFVDSNGIDANQYLLNSEDIDKLDLLTNAGEGSLAYCVDTKVLYVRHENTWKEV